jgi:hypothetical protein
VSSIARIRVLLAIVVALTLVLPARHTDARGPDLRMRPNDGPVGGIVTARGEGFASGENVHLWWSEPELEVATVLADGDGAFSVDFTVPDVPPGAYEVTAIGETTGETAVASDEFDVTVPDDHRRDGPHPEPSAVVLGTPAPLSSELAPNACDLDGTRAVAVSTSTGLEAALADALPGDHIALADGTYRGNFVAENNGSATDPIALCGGRGAVIDGGAWSESGYALHLRGDHWAVSGITVTNAQKGVMADGVTGIVIDGIEVHTIGHEAIYFRTHSTDNTIQNSEIHDTGLDNEKFGEGIYLGTAVSNWSRYTDGEPDRSDRNRVLANRIWNTTSESIDAKEGSEGGLIEGNVFDGSMLSGADSWVDVKGNGYVVRGNTGTASPQDGFQTHVIDDMRWGRGNVFEGNVAIVNGPGAGFYIHQPDESGNIVRCDNRVEGAAFGLTNLEGGCNG